MQHNMNVAHPKYDGHMLTFSPTIALAADALASALNPNQIGWEVSPASTYAAIQTFNWMCSLIGWEPQPMDTKSQRKSGRFVYPGGVSTAGGTIANQTALLVARNKALLEYFQGLNRKSKKKLAGPAAKLKVEMSLEDLDVTEAGLISALRPFFGLKGFFDFRKIYNTNFIILTSNEAHYSMKKLAGYIGIGGRNAISIPVDSKMRMRPEMLEQKIRELRTSTVNENVILAIVATAGTTATGNYDPITDIADIAAKYGIWLHVDGAYGGAVLLSDQYRYLVNGIDRADSVTIDGHKWLFELPYALGFAGFKDGRNLTQYLKQSAPYVIHADSDVPDLGGFSVQGSMRFSDLKLWMTWAAMGSKIFSSVIDHNVTMAKHFERMVKNQPELEGFSEVEIDLYCYRYVPKAMKRVLDMAMEKGDIEAIAEISEYLNKFNSRIKERLQNSGKGWLSREELPDHPMQFYLPEIKKFTEEQVASGKMSKDRANKLVKAIEKFETLRMTQMNPFTEREDMDAILEETIALGRQIYREWLRNNKFVKFLENERPEYAEVFRQENGYH